MKNQISKKLAAMFLSICMVATLTPNVAFIAYAEDAGGSGSEQSAAVTDQDSLEAAVAAAQAGDTVEIAAAGEYTIPNLPNNITVKGTVEGVVFDCNGTGSIASVPNGATFENVTMSFGANNNNYHGFQAAGTINMNGCTLNGKFFSYGVMNFKGCTFNAPGTEASGISKADYSMWAYGMDLTYTDCTFNGAGKFINVYNEGGNFYSVKASGCTFNSTVANKAAFNVKETCVDNGKVKVLKYNIAINNCTTNKNFPAASSSDSLVVISPLVQVDDRMAGGTPAGGEVKVTLDGKEVYSSVQKFAEDAQGVYHISTAAQLVKFAELVNDGTASGKDAVLEADIDMAGVDFTPIGTSSKAFGGTFDGNGKTISNLTVSKADAQYVGLFGEVQRPEEPAVVKDLTVKNAAVTGSKYVGVIAGHVANGRIQNCTVEGAAVTGEEQVGTVAGYIANGFIKECTVTDSDVKATVKTAGGIAGRANVDTAYEVIGNTISDSTVQGTPAAALVGQTLTAENRYSIKDNSVVDVTVKDKDGADAYNPIANFYSADSYDAKAADNIVNNSWEPITTPNYFDMKNPADSSQYVRIKNANKPKVAKIGETEYNDLSKALQDAVSSKDDVTVEIIDDIDLTDADWTPVNLSGKKNVLTIEGNEHAITGLSDILIGRAWASKGLVINDLTIKDSNIIHDENDSMGDDDPQGVGAFVGYIEATETVTLNNCHVIDSTVNGGHWVGGFVGVCGGYNNANDGPVFTTLTITDSTAEGCTIKNNGSAGAFIGHGATNLATKVVLNGEATGNSISGGKPAKTGKLIGTIGACGAAAFNGEKGGIELDVVESGNTGATNVAGRIGSTGGTMIVTGGSYESDPLVTSDNAIGTIAVKEGFKIAKNADGTYKVVERAHVAQIGDEKYYTLADAIAAVPADGTETTIKMIADEMIPGNAGVTVAAGKNIILDLNGFTLSNSVNENKTSQVIANKGTLTIKDSSESGKGKITNAVEEGTQAGEWWGTIQYNYATNVITNTGNLTIEAGELLQTAKGSICYAIDNNSSGADAILNIKDGHIHTLSSTAVRMFANSTTKKNEVNLSGGTVEASYAGLWIQLPGSGQKKLAALNMTGGTLKGGYAFYDYSYGDLFDDVNYIVSGGTLDGDVFSYGANMTISEGEFKGEVAIKQSLPSNVSVTGGTFNNEVYTYGDNPSVGFISGGTFKNFDYEYGGETYNSIEDMEDFLADGMKFATGEDGWCVVAEMDCVAQAGSKKFESLEDAVKAAKSGDTVTLLKDAAGNGITIDKDITIDFGGFTYTVDGNLAGSTGTKTQGFQLLKDRNITFKNGKITSEKAKMLIQNYSNLTLEAMTLDGSKLAGEKKTYTVSNNNGNVAFTKGTEIIAKDGNVAFDLYDWASSGYNGISLTMDDDIVINGAVEIGGDRDALSIKIKAPETMIPEAIEDYKWVKDSDGFFVLTQKDDFDKLKDQVDELQKQVDANKEALETLDDSYATDADVAAKIAAAKAAIEEAQAMVDAAQNAKAAEDKLELANAIKEAKEALKAADNTTLEAAKAYTDAEAAKLQQQVDANKAALAALDDTYATDADVAAKIKEANDAIEATQKAIDAAQDEQAATDKTELLAAIKSAKEALEAADTATLTAAKAYTDEVKAALEESIEAIKDAEVSNKEELNSAIEEAKTAAENAQNAVDALTGAYNASTGSIQDQINTLKDEIIAALQTQISELEARVAALEARVDALESSKTMDDEATNNRIQMLEDTVKELKAQLVTVSLSKSTFIYTGKENKPEIIVKDSVGNKLVEGTDYAVTPPSDGTINVGVHTYTVNFAGEYKGTKNLSINVNPAIATIKSLKAGKKKMTVKLSKNASSMGATTYQIYYKQKGTSKWKSTTTTTQSKTIKKLKKGKKYYVKVRAYKKVGSKTYYGAWSKTKLSKKIK
ncbi:MAG: hypothetical protein KBS63_05625 [Clostridiales bacterium]|nr:hypothetical protein [Candidatus Crickella caballi]